MSKLRDVDAEIDEYKASDAFNDMLHGDDLLADFDKMVAKVKCKDWFNADISEKTVKEYYEVMTTPYNKRDETLRRALERYISTAVLAQYADKNGEES